MTPTLLQLGVASPTATLLAAGVGFVTGILSSFGVFWWRMRTRRRSLRHALRRELAVPADVIQRAMERDSETVETPFHAEIPTIVYESQGPNLGLLTDEELDPLIAYYSTAQVARSQLQSLDDDDVAERFFTETVPILERKRQHAVSAIDERL